MPVTTVLNVKNFGAVCDGQTDDTTAITSTYNAAASAMDKQGGAGIVYFPPSTGYCVVSTLHVPSMGYPQGWLTSVFDNGLFVTDRIYPGNNNAFIGRTSNFAAMGNSFLWGPTAAWQKPKWSVSTQGPVVELDGADQVYFEGIAIGNALNGGEGPPPAVRVQNVPGFVSANLNFIHCSIMGDFDVEPDEPTSTAGFGLHFVDSTLGDLNIENFGMITIRGGYLHKVAMTNVGSVNMGDLELDDTLSEGLNNEDFLTLNTSGGTISDITLHRVRIADPVGTVYMVKHINNTGINWNVNIKFDQIPFNETGSGLIDPSSAPDLFSVVCIGSNCADILNQAKSTLYMYVGMPPKSPMLLYGSAYIGNPLVIVH